MSQKLYGSSTQQTVCKYLLSERIVTLNMFIFAILIFLFSVAFIFFVVYFFCSDYFFFNFLYYFVFGGILF